MRFPFRLVYGDYYSTEKRTWQRIFERKCLFFSFKDLNKKISCQILSLT
ncbi:hypothetical protein HMPREF1548_00220 [Clostridium sp. KLE 1755]|nr:hypothetical protein HMPREF1548_00220 [Clostridium sp. KLE 1755]